MPKKKLPNLSDKIANLVSNPENGKTEDDIDDLMYDVFDEIKKQLRNVLCFGPSNSILAEKLKSRMLYEPRFFNYKPSEENLVNAIRSQQKIDDELPPKLGSIDLEEMFLSGFISGTGTCEIFAIVAAVLLCSQYDVEVSIINIHSDLVHTFLKIHTNPAYIFDYWADFMIREYDWTSWNECHEPCYHYRPGVVFKPLMSSVPKGKLTKIAQFMEDEALISKREKHIESIMPSASSQHPKLT